MTNPRPDTAGVGATSELTLRVSVATLVRVTCARPSDATEMLALERKATVHGSGSSRVVEVSAQPFGGAVRLLDLHAVRDVIGDFHFDSERSRVEHDLRLFIRPSRWPALRAFCVERLGRTDDPVLETDAARELAEEFADTLAVDLQPHQYVSTPVATVVVDDAAPTANVNAKGVPTVRIYRISAAAVIDPALAAVMAKGSAGVTDQDLRDLATADALRGGKGRANGMLTVPLDEIIAAGSALSPEQRSGPFQHGGHRMSETVLTVLGVGVPGRQPPG